MLHFNGTIIITDPCYIHNIWNDGIMTCTSIPRKGISRCIWESTIYGDWSCTTFNSDTEEVLGEFCADAGQVGVFLLEEVLAVQPNLLTENRRTHWRTIIKDFKGEVEYKVENDEARLVGRGNINFHTEQTGA